MKRLFLLILISCFPLNNIFGMDKPPVAPNKQTTGNKVPLVLNAKEREISQMNWRFPLDQNQLDDLISVANKGDYQMQYLLGLHYMHGYTPTRKKDFVQAEKWLLLARKNDYLPAYTMLVDLAMDQNNFEKWISYAREAAQRGFLDQNYNVGIAYKLQKKYKKAQEFFEETIKDLQPYQDDPNFKWVRDGALVEMANLLKKGQLGFKDTKKAMDIFKELASSNNIQALYFLALAYLYGNEVIQKNPRTAESLLLKIEQSTIPRTGTDKIFYLQALNVLGWMFENGLAHNKPDLNKAIEYYKKEYDYAGKFHIARLILAGKIQGNSDQAKKILESASEGDNPNTLAAFLLVLF